MLEYAMKYYYLGLSPIPLHSPIMLRAWQRPKGYGEEIIQELIDNNQSETPLLEEDVIKKIRTKVCKTSLVKWEDYKQKRPTEKEVQDWFNTWPSANIGLMTGRYHGLIVFDSRTSETAEYIDSMGGFPDTVEVDTGFSAHHYFQCPTNNSQSRNVKKFGINIIGDDNYIVAPPSIHGANRLYRCISAGPIINDEFFSCFKDNLAECSQWMLDFIEKY